MIADLAARYRVESVEVVRDLRELIRKSPITGRLAYRPEHLPGAYALYGSDQAPAHLRGRAFYVGASWGVLSRLQQHAVGVRDGARVNTRWIDRVPGFAQLAPPRRFESVSCVVLRMPWGVTTQEQRDLLEADLIDWLAPSGNGLCTDNRVYTERLRARRLAS